MNIEHLLRFRDSWSRHAKVSFFVNYLIISGSISNLLKYQINLINFRFCYQNQVLDMEKESHSWSQKQRKIKSCGYLRKQHKSKVKTQHQNGTQMNPIQIETLKTQDSQNMLLVVCLPNVLLVRYDGLICFIKMISLNQYFGLIIYTIFIY